MARKRRGGCHCSPYYTCASFQQAKADRGEGRRVYTNIFGPGPPRIVFVPFTAEERRARLQEEAAALAVREAAEAADSAAARAEARAARAEARAARAEAAEAEQQRQRDHVAALQQLEVATAAAQLQQEQLRLQMEQLQIPKAASAAHPPAPAAAAVVAEAGHIVGLTLASIAGVEASTCLCTMCEHVQATSLLLEFWVAVATGSCSGASTESCSSALQ
jgi:multidrug efflux pump subunit AcrA (membrane-fusion protein)